jgi:S1-C subfamily serine protease
MRRGLFTGTRGGLVAIIAGLVFTASAAVAKPLSEGGFLGVYTSEMDIALLEAIHYDGEGVLVQDVVKDSPADSAGIKPGDILVKFNNRIITSPRNLERALWRTDPGDKATVVLWRDNKEKTVTVTVAEKNESDNWVFNFPKRAWSSDSTWFKSPKVGYLGINMIELEGQLAEYFGAKNGGVLIKSVEEDSPAEKAGFKAGDVIVKIDKTQVDESDKVSDRIREHKKGDQMQFTILRDKKEKTITATLDEKETFYWSGEPLGPVFRRIIKSIPRHRYQVQWPEVRIEDDAD